MKLLSSLLLILAIATPAVAADIEIPHVTVFGTAVTQTKPDLLRWSVTVSNKGAELAQVSQEHASHTAAVLRLLSQKAIRPEETQTSGMRFSEAREHRGSSWLKDGYIAATNVSFTMRNLADYEEMWLELSHLAGVSVDYVSWDASNRIDVQNTTRIQALRNALTKAEQMATALGRKIAEPLTIEEVAVEDPWSARNMMSNSVQPASAQPEDGGEILAPGSVSIRIRVRVVFQLATP